MSIKPSVVYIKGVHSTTGHDTDSDIGFPQLELEKLFEGAIIKETTDTAYDSNKKYIHYDSLNNQVAIQDTGHFNCIKNGYYSIANEINHYYTKSGDNYNYNAVPSNVNTWVGKWSFSNTIKNKDLYSISLESDRICVNNSSYYEKSGNNYINQAVKEYDLYKEGQKVLWDNNHKYRQVVVEVEDDEGITSYITTWKRVSDNTPATSGFYLLIDEATGTSGNKIYNVKLCNLTFASNGTTQDNLIGILYKLDTDNSFGAITWYIKNGNKLEKLINNTAIVFNTNPAGTPNFYLYKNLGSYTYPNTIAPAPASLYTDSGSSVYKSFNINDYPVYTEIETMTAYVGDKAKLSVSGTKATLALPGLYWTKANMDMAFYNCSSFNQKMIIQNSVTSMVSTFEGCSSFNQPDMLIYSQNITNMTNAFKGCNINNVHVPTSVPKDTSNFMYNCLVNGNTGITFPASNIFNDLN